MLYEHNYKSAFIDFDSTNDYEIERQIEWKERKQALELAIKALSKKGDDLNGCFTTEIFRERSLGESY